MRAASPHPFGAVVLMHRPHRAPSAAQDIAVDPQLPLHRQFIEFRLWHRVERLTRHATAAAERVLTGEHPDASRPDRPAAVAAPNPAAFRGIYASGAILCAPTDPAVLARQTYT